MRGRTTGEGAGSAPPTGEHNDPPRSMPRLLSTKDLATYFGVSEAAIRKRIRLGQLAPVIRLGRGYVMREEALLRLLESKEAEVLAPR